MTSHEAALLASYNWQADFATGLFDIVDTIENADATSTSVTAGLPVALRPRGRGNLALK